MSDQPNPYMARGIIEGARIFREAIDRATGTTAPERRAAVDQVCDRQAHTIARQAMAQRSGPRPDYRPPLLAEKPRIKPTTKKRKRLARAGRRARRQAG